jgi:hypothetical protein
VHGYVHNDYRILSKDEQFTQTKQAISVFQNNQIPYQGLRNPYLDKPEGLGAAGKEQAECKTICHKKLCEVVYEIVLK